MCSNIIQHSFTFLKWPVTVTVTKLTTDSSWLISGGALCGKKRLSCANYVHSHVQAVQVYISWLDASVPTPQIQLVAVKRVFIKADSLLQVTLALFWCCIKYVVKVLLLSSATVNYCWVIRSSDSTLQCIAGECLWTRCIYICVVPDSIETLLSGTYMWIVEWMLLTA